MAAGAPGPPLRDHGRVAGAELLSAAVAELYAADLDAFTARRGELAAQARAAGAAAVAKKIAGLRKPTRPAWLLNQLARADPSIPARLAELGDELRRAEAALDGDRIRELSQARRRLVDAATRQALALAGPHPTAALRDEVAATLAAAVADPDVAEQLAEGALPRAVHHAGFGSGMPPALSLVRSTGSRPAATGPAAPEPERSGAGQERTARVRTGPAKTAPARTGSARTGSARTGSARARLAEAERARTEREQQRAAAARAKAARVRAEREYRQALAAATKAAADADRAAAAAAQAEQNQESTVRRLEQELADARQQLTEARQRARQAAGAQRVAHRALDRLHDQAAD